MTALDPEFPPKVDPPRGTFAGAFLACFCAFVLMNVVWWLLISTPQSQSIGWPVWFWREHGDYSRISWGGCVFDFGLAFFASYRFATWFWLRRWRQNNSSAG